MSRYRALVIVAAVLLAGCPPDNNENGNPNNIQIDPNNSSNTTMQDMGPADMDPPPVDMGNNSTPIDLGPTEDFALPDVETEGFMHGDWQLVTRGDSTFIASLRISHNEGDTMLAGTYQMDEPPAFGRLAGTTWVEETFTSSWTVDVEGSNERFTLTNCVRDNGSNDQLVCRHGNTIDNDIIDANLVRQ